ncbi:MBL fold metallo-hydrolase [Acuticoccus sediminis]|uniref:MBL fold metallo-hydrolase n=1 Tax=Acuticoccus sediminis TaxID=2184697 RepID=A0A8B2NLL0_9HYPH|nr:MBL fold metallo-hydrolase [Acuticoccus sediminis]RAH99420.1 MBL fold metallo-hydrolase [Acuticoccus sediminis]
MTKRNPDTLSLTIWGARGSIPAPGPHTLRYGGETTCLEIRAGSHVLLIDCGSGARSCGAAFAQEGIEQLDVLFTHTHMDHLCGLPFFCSAYDPNCAVSLWAGHIPPGGTLEEIVERMMSPPIFPVATSALRNTVFRSFRARQTFTLDSGLSIASTRLNHPGNGCGYRIEWGGSSIAIITDHEHGDDMIDDAIAEFVTGADLMIYDAMYLEEEYPKYVGWGHSTPTQALDLAARAGVAIPMIFHHDPSRSDDALDMVAREVATQLPGAQVATQGQTIHLTNGKVEIGTSRAA